ncbi:hypothetical protein [Azospirillum doebereinerae]
MGFDNARVKGDDQHHNGAEHPYAFVDVDRLLADFIAAVRQWRTDHDRA